MPLQKVKSSSWDSLDNFGYVNLSDLGTIGTTLDFGPLILAAVTAGFAVYIPVGEFTCSPMILPANSVIFGAGNKSILKLKDNSNQVFITVASGSDIRNIKINGNKANQISAGSHGIEILNALETTLSGVNTSNCKGDGINIQGTGTDGVVVNMCSSTGYTGNGIKIESGNNIVINNCRVVSSDATAVGDGISITSSGNPITGVTISSCVSNKNIGKGISIVGSGSRNVKNVTVSNSQVTGNTNHGIFLINAENCSVSQGYVSNNLQDGVRIEGDVQFCRINDIIINGNTTFGLREVTAGASPNNNGLIYNVVRSNGSDVITKVGLNSFIV